MSKKDPILLLKDGTKLPAKSFGHETSVAGEVVFTTGMVGYPESMTDPSYKGQILMFTYPMIGNYGVPDSSTWESDRIHTSAIIVSSYMHDYTHHESVRTLGSWLRDEKIPGIEIEDTRLLTQKIREHGTMLGKIVFDDDTAWYDPDTDILQRYVSVDAPKVFNVKNAKHHVVLIDCGVKQNIIRSLNKRQVDVTVVPYDFDVAGSALEYDGVLLSNGPGDPKTLTITISHVRKLLHKNVPMLGICFGNQILSLAAGGDTKKMKFGHRSQNQPCQLLDGSNKFYLTSQNHGFEVSCVPEGFKPWFINANDGTNEGVIHTKKPFMSVQFHPEAYPGPTDTAWVFDEFISVLEGGSL